MMRVSSLLKILLMCAAIPLRAIDDEAGAAPSSTEPAAGNAAGGASSAEPSPAVTSADGAAAGDGAGEKGNDQPESNVIANAAMPTATGEQAASTVLGADPNADASTSLAGAATSVVTDADVGNVAAASDATAMSESNAVLSNDAGIGAADLPNGTAPAADADSANAAASSALNVSTGAGTAESQEAGTTAGEPHPALAHLSELEAMVDRMLLRAEHFAIDEWKAVINAARAVL
jgi:hypothetical protein